MKVLRVWREGQASSGADRTLLLISEYMEHDELFRNVNVRRTWAGWGKVEITDTRFSQVFWPQQCFLNDWKKCLFYREIAEFYGYRPNVRPYATSSSSGKAVSKISSLTQRLQFSLLSCWGAKQSADFFRAPETKRIRISRISGISVRLANEKLTYSGISQTNSPLTRIDFHVYTTELL